jgi:hypothetical protein
MTYRLKPGQPGMEVVDGPFAGRKYHPDQVYDEIPPSEAERFERTDKAPVVPMPKRERAAAKGRIEDESA